MSISEVSILGKDQIFIGYNISEDIVSKTLKDVPSSTYVLVTDANLMKFSDVAELKAKFKNALRPDQRLLEYIIPPGELSKTRKTKEQVEDFMFAQRCTRESVVLAVGGGVLGDMIGYVASTFMRGIRYVQIPTTLLSMVDSSIGGKTAVDTPAGKNLVGSFWQPELNFIELKFLETLPRREFLNGMSEVIKTAAIWNADEFDRLEKVNVEFMQAFQSERSSTGRVDLSGIREDLLLTVKGSVQVKAEVVTLDEREGGLRNILNFGHSIGHAYEAILAPHVLHGECVSIGSVLEAELSRYLGHLSPSAVARLINCFKSYDLPISIADPIVKARSRGVSLPVDKILDLMAVDKKNVGASKRVTLLSEIGKTFEPKASAVSDEDLRVIISEDVSVYGTSSQQNVPTEVQILPPGSKSISNRVLILCALTAGTCRIKNLLHSDDTGYMLDALQEMGFATVTLEDGGETLVVTGTGLNNLKTPSKELYLGNAGTAARFLTALCTLCPEPVRLNGNKRMQERPIGALVDALKTNGSSIKYLKNINSLPIEVGGNGFKGGRISLEATVSSQYVSALLMVAPSAQEPVILNLTGGQPISQFYIDMTIQMMADFGIKVEKSKTEEHTYIIPTGKYIPPKEYTVESDASSSTYPLAFAALNNIKCTVPSIGSSSLQGDALFGPLVLKPMGYSVSQSANSTTCVGTTKTKGIKVNMEPMTDAFMTACVVAAVADGKTEITGIANQRVKECDRIHAMHVEMAKFGVKTEETDDGIIIYGDSNRASLKTPSVPIHSYDDHRIAMSLSLLATQVNGPTIIDDRRCVAKTWPGWWDILHTRLGVTLEGVSLKIPGSAAIKRTHYKNGKSIVLIGMRGVGKTTLGKAAAKYLKFEFVDLDEEIERVNDIKIPQIIATEGWEKFRDLECKSLQVSLQSRSENHVIACGGGVVETAECRDALKKFSASGGLVVHVQRSMQDVQAVMNADTTRPAFDSEFETVYNRRKRHYIESSDCLLWQPAKYEPAEIPKLLPRFLYDHSIPDVNQYSWFVSLTAPNLRDFNFTETCDGCSAVELRVDLLESWTEEYVADSISFLRLKCPLPIILTVRSVSQGGKFPDTESKLYADLISLGFRMKVEYIDIELTRPEVHDMVLKNKGGLTRIIASHHDPQGKWSWSGSEWFTAFFDANRLGDIVKLVGFANRFEDNLLLEEFRKAVAMSKVPFIGLNMGEKGKMSRMFNKFLTPVTHENLPSSAAPGQLSIKEINTQLCNLGAINKLQYFIAGTPVQKSPSPDLHNGLFSEFGYPHQYSRLETDNYEILQSSIETLGAQFGGASITIPLKQDAMSILDEISDDAKVIGAVNTITRLNNGSLKGDNTDWIGIRRSFEQNGIYTGSKAVIIGAGGTACAAIYAFYKMGFQEVFVLNRTASRAEELVRRFKALNIKITVVSDFDVSKITSHVVFSCIPGNSEKDTQLFKAADQIFARTGRGVILDASYVPTFTNMLSLASSAGWNIIPGRAMLRFQGIEQFFIWTGVRPTSSAYKFLPEVPVE
ncbi:pentafunctional protein [Starmerella bacillaris]|uniref:Pentafunctional AROM polypeptide n=1 Tax=Starmerella bacillaris TaxID=1247836 RepID=A0AAV5RI12_STABA|nr:pentafunctional protein [Starmerella bacillaris]